jgi:serine/threonine kinase 32
VSAARPTLANASFKVFDFSKTQRQSYYHPTQTTGTMQTTSSATAVSTSSADLKVSGSPVHRLPSRPATPSDKTGLASRTGFDVEAQILDGGGMANLNGRGLDGRRDGSIDVRPSPKRQPSALRPTTSVELGVGQGGSR